MPEPEFEIEEGSFTKHLFLKRKTDGREFICTRFYYPNLGTFKDVVDADDDEALSKKEEVEVLRAIRDFLGE